MKKIKRMNKVSVINFCAAAVFGLSLLGFLGMSSVAPSASATDAKSEQIEVTIGDNLTLLVTQPTTGGPAGIQAEPESSAPATGFSDVYVSTNNSTGASLAISMINTDPASGALYSITNGAFGGNSSNTSVISGLTGNGAAIGANQWGYRFFDISTIADNVSYDINTTDVSSADTATPGTAGFWNAVPAFGSGLNIWTSSNFNTAGTRTIRNIFGTRVDNTLPADSYSNQVLYTASTNSL
jgi:hypothetical protein